MTDTTLESIIVHLPADTHTRAIRAANRVRTTTEEFARAAIYAAIERVETAELPSRPIAGAIDALTDAYHVLEGQK